MSQKVNLDALIPREDFEIKQQDGPSSPTQTIQIRNLEPQDFFYNVIRKPDFQRETNEWDSEKICGFIHSFLEGDLIPALILWQSGNQIFLIDGAHRLSALIAWVHDDYGDGKTSRDFFDSVIPDEQIRIAERTRKIVKSKIGSYADHIFAIANPHKVRTDVLERSRRLASLALQLQWVKGDATKAEASFKKINQQAAPIDKTEFRLIEARTLPNALAARAIVRSGTGHKYWSRFDEIVRQQIEENAKAINDLLFTPTLETPIKTLDLPVAGKGYSSQTLPLIFDFVNIANNVRNDASLQPDINGQETLRYLKVCRGLVNRLSGIHPSSLGLHPAVYFYSSTGRYQQTAFLAVISLLKTFEEKNKYSEFTTIREVFENFVLEHRILVNQVVVKYGSGLKGYARLQNLFQFLIDRFSEGDTPEQVIEKLGGHDEFSFLQPAEREVERLIQDFDSDTKSKVFLREALREPLRCAICGGYIHKNSITIDHLQRKVDGGRGVSENGQLTHPYCNTTYKN